MYINHIYAMVGELTRKKGLKTFEYHSWKEWGRATFAFEGIRIVARQGFFGVIQELRVYPYLEVDNYPSDLQDRFLALAPRYEPILIEKDKINLSRLEEAINESIIKNVAFMEELGYQSADGKAL